LFFAVAGGKEIDRKCEKMEKAGWGGPEGSLVAEPTLA